jgi:hypothetical protein
MLRSPDDIVIDGVPLSQQIVDHGHWQRGKGGKRLVLCRADISRADLSRADLSRANLSRADLSGANLYRASLFGANLSRANLSDANLSCADLSDAGLSGCIGNMRAIRSMQIDTWPVTYTANTLQIGCQRHPIAKWREWGTEAGRRWIAAMDGKALEWAERNLALVMAMIDANPATPTGHEKEAA